MSSVLKLEDRVSKTSRRTIIATGAKLAYATPLVAATMKLSASGALAVSGGRRISVPALNPAGVDVDVSGAVETCISASGDALLCIFDDSRAKCPVTPDGTNSVCPGGSACCTYDLCGELLGKLDGGPVIRIGAGPTCLDTSGASTLTLFIADSFYPDNSGSYTAIVTP